MLPHVGKKNTFVRHPLRMFRRQNNEQEQEQRMTTGKGKKEGKVFTILKKSTTI